MPNPPKTKTPAQIAAEKAKYQTTTTYGKDAFPKSQKEFSQFGYEPVSGSYKSGDALYKRKADGGKEEFFYFGDLPKTKDATDYWGMFPTANPNAVTTQPIIPPVKNNTPNPADVIKQPVEFGTAGTYNPNTGLNIDYNNKVIEPIVEQYKKGGKIKGYADGGQTSDNSKQVAGLAGMGAGILGEYGGQALDKQFMDEQGRYKRNPEIDQYSPQGLVSNFYNKGTLAGGVKGAGKGAALGASLGPEGALIGAGVGLLAGSVAGTLKANKDAKSIRNDFNAMKQQDVLNEQAKKQAAIDLSLNKQLTDRELGYKNGGKIEGSGTAKSDSITAKIKPNSFVIPAENSATAEVIRKVVLKAPVKKANLNQAGGTKVKLSNDEHLFTPEEKAKVESKGINLEALAPNAKKELPGDKQQLMAQKEMLGFKDGGSLADAMKSGNKTSPKSKTPKPITSKKSSSARTSSRADVDNTIPSTDLENAYGENSSGGVDTDLSQDKTPAYSNSSSNGLKIGDLSKIGDAAVNLIPYAQTAYGLQQLKKLGKRPVDTLDEDSIKSINEARSNLNLLNADAKFGFTPEEQAMINNENQNLTNAQRYSARNLSGGSAANAYNLERGAINNAFDRALKTKVQNRALMMEKQGIARDQQKYVDELVASKAAANRRLFGDEANAWQQNQAAGSQLLGAGLQNLIGMKRYQDELSAMKNTQGIRNNAFNSLGQ